MVWSLELKEAVPMRCEDTRRWNCTRCVQGQHIDNT